VRTNEQHIMIRGKLVLALTAAEPKYKTKILNPALYTKLNNIDQLVFHNEVQTYIRENYKIRRLTILLNKN
jgi:hypothetical protein